MRIGICGVAVAALAIASASLGCSGGDDPESSARAVAVGGPAEDPKAPTVQVRTSLNRTAVWVGDPIVWTVELICAPTFDIVTDDLAADKLELVGMQLAGSNTERSIGDEGVLIHRVQYHLRSYEIATPALRTAPLSVRYYARRPGQRPEDMAPAGEVEVPGALLAWRSTIPDDVQTVALRDGRSAEEVPVILRVARPVGLVFVLVSVAPAALWGASRIRTAHTTRDRRPSPRASRNETLSALESLRAAETATEADRREAYGRLNVVLRRHVAETTGLPALALTSEEIAERLRASGTRVPGDGVAEALAECDQARYGPPVVVPNADQLRERIAATTRLL